MDEKACCEKLESVKLEHVTPKKKMTLRRQVSIWAKARQSAFGAILCILCALGYATNSFLAKYLMSIGVASPYFVSCSRQALIIAFILPISSFSQTKLVNTPQLNKHWKAITVRCLFGASSLIYYVGLYFAPLADIGVIFTACLPIFSGILSRIIFKERFRYTDFIFMMITALGVTLILRPPYLFPAELVSDSKDTTMSNRLIGGGCTLLSAFCQAVALMGARACVGEVHYSTLVFWNSSTGFIVSVSVMLALNAFQSPCGLFERCLIVGAALSGLVGQASTTLSVRYISPVIASLSSSAELAILFIFQTLLLGVLPHYCSVLGSVLIVCAMVILVIRSWLIDNLKQKHDTEGSVFHAASKHHKLIVTLTK